MKGGFAYPECEDINIQNNSENGRQRYYTKHAFSEKKQLTIAEMVENAEMFTVSLKINLKVQ